MSLQIRRMMIKKDPCGKNVRLVPDDNEDHAKRFHENISDDVVEYIFNIPKPLFIQCMKFFGYQQVYDWQLECLKILCHCNAQPNHCLISMPTGAGKSFPTVVTMLSTFRVYKKDAVFVVPYVSLAEDKVAELQGHAQYGDFTVEAYVGGKGAIPPVTRSSTRTVFVCTIEKFYILVQSLYLTDRLHTLGLVVIDEIHMLGEVERGPTLEATLMQIVHFNRHCVPRRGTPVDIAIQVSRDFSDEGNDAQPSPSSSAAAAAARSPVPDDSSSLDKRCIQVIGLSATVSNAADICSFLDASHFVGSFRPIELKEYIAEGRKLFEVIKTPEAGSRLVSRKLLSLYKHPEANPLTVLLYDTVKVGQSCLVFVSTRERAVQTASHLADELERVQNEKDAASTDLYARRSALRRSLQQDEQDSEEALRLFHAVQSGVCCHHAGLTSSQRQLIEEAFRMKTINVICCTSTLSAGVNLPAEKVVVLDLTIGKEHLQVSRYRQMAGRAGRAGLSTVGACIIMSDETRSKEEILKRFFDTPLEPVVSHMNVNAMQRLLLMKLSKEEDHVTTYSALSQHVQLSLCAVQCQAPYAVERNVHGLFQKCLDSLVKSGLVSEEVAGSPVKLTSSGRVAVRALVSPHVLPSEMAVQVIKDLEDAGRSLITGGTDLHLIYLCVLRKGILKINFHFLSADFKNLVQMLSSAERQVVIYLVQCETNMTLEQFLNVVEVTPPSKGSPRHEFMARLFIAMLFSAVMDKRASMADCAKALCIPYAQVLSTMELVCANGFSLSRICFEFPKCWALQMLLAAASRRLSACLQSSEVGESLTNIIGIGTHRARLLVKAGLKSPVDVAAASPEALIQVFEREGGTVSPKAAERMIISAQEYIKMTANDALEKVKGIVMADTECL